MKTRLLRQLLFPIVSALPSDIPGGIPDDLVRKLHLPSKSETIRNLHFPQLKGQTARDREKELRLYNALSSPAHKRMIFEELFHLQVAIGMVRESRVRQTKKRRIRIDEGVRTAIKRILPFHPTEAQKQALREIADDICSSIPMSRLLQGDVGSGKTIVAAQAAVIVIENGFQTAIMAPTEILAEQHAYCFRKILEPLGYRIDLITGSLSVGDKRRVQARLASGETQIAIGTHALVQESVKFHKLALVVIDEQHRFGVIQRNLLREKGRHPDVLVMTATPIPRSLALTLYGDLDVSVIQELPPGRKPVKTLLLDEKDRVRALEEMRLAVEAGHQVYVVYPLVEESGKSDLRAATEGAAELQNRISPKYRVGLLHGRMKAEDKETTMREFAAGAIQILVATTVIEVGVDVANATLMIIEHAERFGLAQLHQLRGRVGRGAAQSSCILVGNVQRLPDAARRLQTLCDTNDGFKIAEVDLELRGPGEMIGSRQSGIPAFRFANLLRDRRALEIARVEADRFIHKAREHPDSECLRVSALIRERWKDHFSPALS